MNWTEEEYHAYLARRHGHKQFLPRPVLLAEDMAPEWRFQARVVEVAEAQGYRCFHAHTNKRNKAGFPDLTLGKPGVPLLFAELKTNTGVVEAEQTAWLAILHAPPYIIAEVWRPAHWQHILTRLGYEGI